MTAKEIIMDYPNSIKHEELEGKGDCIFQFKISGDSGGHFTMHIQGGQVTVTEGSIEEVNCIITTYDDVFVEIYEHKKNLQMAVFMGKLKCSNLAAFTRFAKALGLM